MTLDFVGACLMQSASVLSVVCAGTESLCSLNSKRIGAHGLPGSVGAALHAAATFFALHLPATHSSPLAQSSFTLQAPGSFAASTHLPLWHFLFLPQAPSSVHSGFGTQRFASQTKPGLQLASVA